MSIKKTLSKLTFEDFNDHNAWESTGDYTEDEDASLSPVVFDDMGRIPDNLEEVWCLCKVTFANDSEYLGTAMCRGDTPDGPLLWSVWNGNEYVPLILPPSPPFVLEKEGPEFFASKFKMKKEEIFPLIIKTVPKFAKTPEIRTIKLGVTGVL